MGRKIFISHSSKDSLLVEKFIEKILILGLNLSKEEIFCTSFVGSNIKSGKDFKLVIKENIEKADVGMLMITANYKESEICLNEMGALWVLCPNVIPFILEPILYDNVGFIHNTSQLLKLNSKNDLLKLADDHKYLRQEKTLNLLNYSDQIDQFISCQRPPNTKMKRLEKIGITPRKEDFEKYFEKFFEPDINIANLIVRAQPTLDDCIKVFTEKYARTLFGYYSRVYTQILDHNSQDDFTGLSSISHDVCNYKQIKDGDHDFPGGMDKLYSKSALKPNNSYYIIRFHSEDQSDGISLKFWCYLNDRWVFFPGILGITDQVDEVIEDPDVQSIIKYASRFGIGKKFSESDFAVIATSYIITEVIRRNKTL